MRGFLAGAFGLIVLQVLASTPAASGRVGGLLESIGTLVRHALSPDVPAIPDLRITANAGASAGPATTTIPPAAAGGVMPAAMPRLAV